VERSTFVKKARGSQGISEEDIRGTAASAGQVSPWFFRPAQQPGAEVRLFCFPYAGGGAHAFHGWQAGLAGTAELWLLSLPGRGSRWNEPPFTGLAPLARSITKSMQPLLNRPFAFFGHSMGALLGFELARELRRNYGAGPVHFFASGRTAPHLKTAGPALHNLPEAQFLEHVRNLNGTSDHVLGNKEMMDMMLPVLRADFAACETYSFTPEPPFNFPITVFCGADDPEAGFAGMEAWAAHTKSEFQAHLFPGNHFFLHTARDQVLRKISETLCRDRRYGQCALSGYRLD
jgi:medium-chain acyl-[acyl-carrier-protein] hydrolase